MRSSVRIVFGRKEDRTCIRISNSILRRLFFSRSISSPRSFAVSLPWLSQWSTSSAEI